jgi:hypothetical protein
LSTAAGPTTLDAKIGSSGFSTAEDAGSMAAAASAIPDPVRQAPGSETWAFSRAAPAVTAAGSSGFGSRGGRSSSLFDPMQEAFQSHFNTLMSSVDNARIAATQPTLQAASKSSGYEYVTLRDTKHVSLLFSVSDEWQILFLTLLLSLGTSSSTLTHTGARR